MLLPFLTTGKLLYMGPWIAERLASVKDFFANHLNAFHPITRSILTHGHDYSGIDAFSAAHQLESLHERRAGRSEVGDDGSAPPAYHQVPHSRLLMRRPIRSPPLPNWASTPIL